MPDYHDARGRILSSLYVGISAEEPDPRLGPIVTSLTDDQLFWIAGWLASESFDRITDN